MFLKEKPAAAIAAAILLQSVPAFASAPLTVLSAPAKSSNTASGEVGMISVMRAPAPTVEDEALNRIMKQIARENMGRLVVADDIISPGRRPKKADTAEIARVKGKLAEAIEAANKQDYDKAIIIMKHLQTEHPESAVLLKWTGVYQNWAKDYSASLDTFDRLKSMFPLSSDEIENDFMAAYYEADNKRHLGLDIKDKLPALEELAKKQENFNLGGITRRDILESLVAFQKFMVETDGGRLLTPTDSKALDELWRKIPKIKHCHLDNYFGYNIDELSPIYGNFYRRKDINDAYEERQQQLAKLVERKEIKEVRAANTEQQKKDAVEESVPEDKVKASEAAD